MNKDIKRIVRDLKSKGWEYVGQNKHIKMRSPGNNTIVMAVSPSCHHAIKNIEQQIKRIEKQDEAITR